MAPDTPTDRITFQQDAQINARQARELGASSNIYLRITFWIQAVLGVSLILFAVRKDWENFFLTSLVIAITLLPTFVFRRYRIVIPPEFQFVSALFVFLSLFLGSVAGFYYRFWWWDSALHGSSGFILGMVGFLAIFVLNQTEKLPQGLLPGFVAFFGVLFAVFLGVIWEIIEFLIDRFTSANMQSLETGVVDTMKDLIVDTLGAFIVGGMAYAYMKTGRYSFVGDGVRKFQKWNPHLFKKTKQKLRALRR